MLFGLLRTDIFVALLQFSSLQAQSFQALTVAFYHHTTGQRRDGLRQLASVSFRFPAPRFPEVILPAGPDCLEYTGGYCLQCHLQIVMASLPSAE